MKIAPLRWSLEGANPHRAPRIRIVAQAGAPRDRRPSSDDGAARHGLWLRRCATWRTYFPAIFSAPAGHLLQGLKHVDFFVVERLGARALSFCTPTTAVR